MDRRKIMDRESRRFKGEFYRILLVSPGFPLYLDIREEVWNTIAGNQGLFTTFSLVFRRFVKRFEHIYF